MVFKGLSCALLIVLVDVSVYAVPDFTRTREFFRVSDVRAHSNQHSGDPVRGTKELCEGATNQVHRTYIGTEETESRLYKFEPEDVTLAYTEVNAAKCSCSPGPPTEDDVYFAKIDEDIYVVYYPKLRNPGITTGIANGSATSSSAAGQ